MSRLTKPLCALTSTLVLIGLMDPAGADDTDGAPPRYRLEVGQEIKYHGTNNFKYENGSFGSKIDWQIWVVRANDDGSWRLVLRSSRRMTRTDGQRRLESDDDDVTLAYCDLFPDGRIVANDSLGFQVDPSSILPRLPKDAAEAQAGWRTEDPRQGTRTEFRKSADGPINPDVWVFDAVRRSPSDKIYLSSHHARYEFDLKRGLVTRVDSDNTQGYGFKGKGTGTEELAAVQQQDDGHAQSLATESTRYFEANKTYHELLQKAGKDAEGAVALLARAEQVLKDVRAALSLPVVRDRVDAQLTQHKQMASYYTEEAKDRAAILGQDAAAWETKDLDGKPHALKDYRGKVVILDFWYRGCGWCIRAMPQVKSLAEDFRGEPVAVLGMNTDREEADARLVVDELALKYPTLKAEGLPEKYHVRGFPTLIIIDQEGKIADVHAGYSPTLREDVSRSVKRLLAGH